MSDLEHVYALVTIVLIKKVKWKRNKWLQRRWWLVNFSLVSVFFRQTLLNLNYWILGSLNYVVLVANFPFSNIRKQATKLKMIWCIGDNCWKQLPIWVYFLWLYVTQVIEHVADPAEFCKSLAALTVSDGATVISTINRSMRSYATAIIAAEYLLHWVWLANWLVTVISTINRSTY